MKLRKKAKGQKFQSFWNPQGKQFVYLHCQPMKGDSTYYRADCLNERVIVVCVSRHRKKGRPYAISISQPKWSTFLAGPIRWAQYWGTNHRNCDGEKMGNKLKLTSRAQFEKALAKVIRGMGMPLGMLPQKTVITGVQMPDELTVTTAEHVCKMNFTGLKPSGNILDIVCRKCGGVLLNNVKDGPIHIPQCPKCSPVSPIPGPGDAVLLCCGQCGEQVGKLYPGNKLIGLDHCAKCEQKAIFEATEARCGLSLPG